MKHLGFFLFTVAGDQTQDLTHGCICSLLSKYHQRIKCVGLLALFPALSQYLKVQTFSLLCLFSLSSALMRLEVNLSAPLGCELSFSASENSSFQHFLPASQ